MTQVKWKALSNKRIDIWVWFFSFLVFLLQVFLLFSPTRENKITNAFSAPIIVALVVYLLIRLGLPRTLIVLLPSLFTFWFLICRIINGDWYLQESYFMVYMILFSCCVLFLLPFLANKPQREKLFGTFAHIYCIIFGAIAWVAVIAALTSTNWINPIDNNYILGINAAYSNPYRLNILGIHPNISSIFFYVSLALLFYLFLKSKKLWARLSYGILAIGLYLAICMSGSISSIIITGLFIGLVAFASIFHKKRTKARALLAAVVMLSISMLVVITYPLVVKITSNVHDNIVEDKIGFHHLFIATAAAQDNQAQEEDTTAQTNSFVNERLEIDTMTLSMQGRFEMYSSAFLSIADRPITLIIGEGWQNAMDRSARMINYPYQNHVHNSFLQTLVVGGGISFVMVLLFTVLLVINCIRLFFNKCAPLYMKTLILVPVGLLCHSMTEAILFVDTRIPNMLFFFMAGMVIVYAREITSANPDKPAQETK